MRDRQTGNPISFPGRRFSPEYGEKLGLIL